MIRWQSRRISERTRGAVAAQPGWAAAALEDLEAGSAKQALLTSIAYVVDRRR